MLRYAGKGGQAETDGREQGKRRTGSAKRTGRRWDTPRCTETGRNGPVGAAKRTGKACCGLRGPGTSRDGRTGTGQEMHEICEADERTRWWASLHGNRQKWTCGCSEADRRGPLYASLRRERGQAETEGREQGKRCTGSARLTRRRWDRRRCTSKCRNEGIDAAKRTRGHDGGRRCTETGRNGPVGAAKRMRGRRSGLRGTRTDRSEPVVAAKRTGEGRCGLRGTGRGWGARGGDKEGARREGEEGGRGGRARRGGEEGVTPMQDKGPEPGLGLRTFVVFCCSAAVVCLVCRCSMSSVLLCGERDAPATYLVSLSRRFLREASSTISPSTSSPSAMMKAAGMAGMLYIPMYGDAFPRASHTFVQGSS